MTGPTKPNGAEDDDRLLRGEALDPVPGDIGPAPGDEEGGQKEEADHVSAPISAIHAAKTSGVSSAISSRDISAHHLALYQ